MAAKAVHYPRPELGWSLVAVLFLDIVCQFVTLARLACCDEYGRRFPGQLVATPR
jgi:hypothetical protein